MSEYFNKVPDPRALLAHERAPITGRRVRKDRAKHPGGLTPQHGRPKWVPIAVAVSALAALGGIVAVARGDDSPAPTAVPSIVAASDPALTIAVTTATPVPSTVVSTTEAAVATAPSSIEPVATTTPAPIATSSFRMIGTVTTSNTGATPLRFYPNNEIVFNDAPVLAFVFVCDAAACRFSLRDSRPGHVAPDGSTAITVVDGRVTVTITDPGLCAAAGGGTVTGGTQTETIDLTLSGTQVINGVSVPTTINGTHTVTFPEIGDVTRNPACAGFTGTSTLSGLLGPG